MSETISVQIAEQIMTIRIQRPQARNALNRDMYQQLTAALQQAQADANVRVALISGCEGSFSSGNDIDDFLQSDDDAESLAPVVGFLHQLAVFPKPLVAAVNGVAIGIGTTMLLHCDLVYAADSAQFQLPFVNLGVVPEGGSSLLLPAMLGHQQAAELLLLGERFDALSAQQKGFVNAVISHEELLDYAHNQALKLAEKPPAAMVAAKALLKSQRGRPLSQVLETEIELFAKHLRSPEAQEALLAFKQRRKPDFSAF